MRLQHLTKSSELNTPNINCYKKFPRWKCRDRRFLIEGQAEVEAECQWDQTYSLVPSELECTVAFCDNATAAPDSNNLLFPWNGDVVPINTNLTYSCKEGMSIEADTSWKDQAPTFTTVMCSSDGTFAYPTWPQCSSWTQCLDPGNSPGVNRSYQRGQDLSYNSMLRYQCTDPRKYIKVSGTNNAAVAKLDNTCHWRKRFSLNGSALECSMHHCGHPYNHPGAHSPPPPEKNITLVTPPGWGSHNWHTSLEAQLHTDVMAQLT